MKDQIRNNIEQPAQLEKMYRQNKPDFTREFNLIYPEISHTASARFWHARLNFESGPVSWGNRTDLIFILIVVLLAGLVAKIPDLTGINHEYFYPRNIAFIVFPFLGAFFAWKHKVHIKTIMVALFVLIASAVYINILPENQKSDTLILACIHLPFVLWATLGFIFSGHNFNNNQTRLDYLKYNADLVVMTALIGIAGGLMTAVTFGLFELIGINIAEYYSSYIAVWGLPACPIVATYLVRTNPQLVNKVSPVIARIFTPVVLVTLSVYLFALVFSGKDPYNDRDFLLIFNGLLIGVMALILFSVVETSQKVFTKINAFLLLGLSLVTVIVNGIALSAILFRISEWGITPNRLAVLGGNLLILINLMIVAYRLFKTLKNPNEIENVGNSIAAFLPVYFIWTAFVTFVVPLIFDFL